MTHRSTCTAAAAALLLACTPLANSSPAEVPTSELRPRTRAQSQPEAETEAATDAGTSVEALVLERVIRARHDTGELYVDAKTTVWMTQDAVRTSKGAVGIVPAIDLLWLKAKGTWRIAEDYVCPWGGFSDGRGFVAQELRLARDDEGALVVPDPVLTHVSEPWDDPEADGLPGTAVYRVGPARSGMVTHLWVSTRTPLTGRDFAGELRRRLSRPWSAAEERLFDAFEQLPGYPVAFRNGMGSYATVKLGRQRVPASTFTLPDARRRSDDCGRELARDYLDDSASRAAAGRKDLGLDMPFTPTPAAPLPPALPGGSCRPERGVCIETWDGVDTQFSGWCDVDTFDFRHSCPREQLVVVCESANRERLLYRYRGAGQTDTCPQGMRRYVDSD